MYGLETVGGKMAVNMQGRLEDKPCNMMQFPTEETARLFATRMGIRTPLLAFEIQKEGDRPYPSEGSLWRNNKTGNIYQVLHSGIHTETEEGLVVYRLAKPKDFVDEKYVWCRPVAMWEEKFTRVKGDRP